MISFTKYCYVPNRDDECWNCKRDKRMIYHASSAHQLTSSSFQRYDYCSSQFDPLKFTWDPNYSDCSPDPRTTGCWSLPSQEASCFFWISCLCWLLSSHRKRFERMFSSAEYLPQRMNPFEAVGCLDMFD